jgi:hypothetical protein
VLSCSRAHWSNVCVSASGVATSGIGF